MPKDMPATPCGSVARSVFNDTYQLWKLDKDGNLDKRIAIDEKNIAWKLDKEYVFHNTHH